MTMRAQQGAESAHVTKLVGAPGSGKTTTMLQLLRDELRDGTPLGDILFLTFTRAAREEVEERLLDIAEAEGAFDPDDEDDEFDPTDGVRTVHGAALKACLDAGVVELRNRDNLEARGDLLIRRGDDRDAPYFKWFFRKHFPTIEYDPEGDDPIEQLKEGGEMDGDTPAGNRVMALYDFLQSKDWPLAAYHRAPISEGIELPDPVILDVLEEWEAFKNKNDLIQDDDYVQTALDRKCLPPGSVLFTDEFQDLSPIQSAVYEMWRDSGAVDRMYIAGDPHQAIYGFRGATPEYFNETRTDSIIHDETSKRCPREVVEAAVPVAAPIPEHDVSRVDALASGGEVEHVNVPSPDSLATLVRRYIDEHGEMFILSRTNRQASKVAYGLRKHGLPYLDVSPSGSLHRWQYPANALLSACRGFDAGDPLPISTLALVLEHSTGGDARRDVQAALDAAGDDDDKRADAVETAADVRPGSLVPARTYREWYPEAENGRQLATRLEVKDWLLELLVDALDSRSTHNPEDVRVGTIHAAKGLGSQCVLVSPTYSHNQLERFHEDQAVEAEERRLFYVAMTRSKHTALIVHGYHGGEEFPPLSR